MSYFPQFPAISPVSGNLVRNATFQAYAPDDDTFTTPLVTRDIRGNLLDLISDHNGVLPQFTVDGGHASVVLKSGAFYLQVTADMWEETRDARDQAVAAASEAVALQDLTIAGRVETASLTQTALDKRYRRGVSVRAFGAVGDGSSDDTAAIQAALDFAYAQHMAVLIPAGDYRIGSADITFHRQVPIIGDGANCTLLTVGPADSNRKLHMVGVRDVPTESGMPLIQGIQFNKIGIIAGESSTDEADGLVLRDVEVSFATTGVEARHKSFLWRFDSCRIHHCGTGVKFAFIQGGSPVTHSGANMIFDGTVIHDCDTGFWQDGIAADGSHTTFTNTDIEHCKVSVKVSGASGSVFDAAGLHFEGNSEAYIQADSGDFTISSVWASELAAASVTKIATFDLSGNARVEVLGGRLFWSTTSKLYKLDGTSQLRISPAVIMPAIGVNIPSAAPGASGHASTVNGVRKTAGSTVYSAAGIAVPHTTETNLLIGHGGDGNTYDVEFAVDLASMGANNNLVLNWRPSTGGVVQSFAMPAAATWAVVRAVWSRTSVSVTVTFSDGSVQTASAALTHAVTATRYLSMQITGAGSATGTARSILARTI